MFLATTGAVLLGAAMLVVFLLRPPLLGWVGFAVVCAIVIGLASFAASSLHACGSARNNRPRRAMRTRGRWSSPTSTAAHQGSGSRSTLEVAGAVAVHLVVPVRVSHLHYLTNGGDDPLESMTDALGS